MSPPIGDRPGGTKTPIVLGSTTQHFAQGKGACELVMLVSRFVQRFAVMRKVLRPMFEGRLLQVTNTKRGFPRRFAFSEQMIICESHVKLRAASRAAGEQMPVEEVKERWGSQRTSRIF